MSIHIPHSPANPPSDDSSSESSESEEETFSDWEENADVPCQSLFSPTQTFGSAQDALAYEKTTHSFDFKSFCGEKGLDAYGRIKFVNWVRKTQPKAADVLALEERPWDADEWLIPVLQDDPLLQMDLDEDEDEEVQTRHAFEVYKALFAERLLDSPPPQEKDEDTHYFSSYASPNIHYTMLSDKIRTSSYANFILSPSSSHLFSGTVVLDVGCGTGILSLFAAKAGAKKVYAVDASKGVVEKAREIVKANGLDNVIQVIHGKVEDINLDEKVDVIVSEWMGYALLYESMLDSVLTASQRFLRPGGVLAPSECHIQLALADPKDVIKERVEFWDDVYGFDMSTMADPSSSDAFKEAIIDTIDAFSLLSSPEAIWKLHLPSLEPNFLTSHSSHTAPFTLVSTSPRRTKLTAFVLWFDTFFSPSGRVVRESTKAKEYKEGELGEVWPIGGRPNAQRRKSSTSVKGRSKSRGPDEEGLVSFTTSPTSMPTHWQQTIFLLPPPHEALVEGSKVEGTFYIKKSADNERELDVEIHFSVEYPDDYEGNGKGKEREEDKGVTVVMYNVR